MPNITPKSGLLILLSILLLTYSLYQARFLIFGPEIEITSHKDGDVVEAPVIILEGFASNISRIILNDRQIFTDENGKWSERLAVFEGLNIMTIRASDRFGRETRKTVRIILN